MGGGASASRKMNLSLSGSMARSGRASRSVSDSSAWITSPPRWARVTLGGLSWCARLGWRASLQGNVLSRVFTLNPLTMTVSSSQLVLSVGFQAVERLCIFRLITIMLYGFIFSATTAVFALLWSGTAGVAMLRQFKRQPASRSRNMASNPLNAVLSPALLTERGQMFRRRYLAGLFLFLVSVAASGALAHWM